jgi:5'(3')-deoxyribonucleotidase
MDYAWTWWYSLCLVCASNYINSNKWWVKMEWLKRIEPFVTATMVLLVTMFMVVLLFITVDGQREQAERAEARADRILEHVSDLLDDERILRLSEERHQEHTEILELLEEIKNTLE